MNVKHKNFVLIFWQTLTVTMATSEYKYSQAMCTPEILESIVMDDEGDINWPSSPYDEVYDDVLYISDG